MSALLALACAWLAPWATPALAQDVSEYGMKAVLFYRLPQFIYWPEGSRPPQPMVMCVVGQNPFDGALNQLDQASAGMELRLAPTDPGACHVLFIARTESGNLDTWLRKADTRRTITVSDIPGFARAGGMIELPLEGDRVGIVLNRKTARRLGYEFNAQLLRLARIIEP